MRAVKPSPTIELFDRQPSTTFNGRHVERDTELTVEGVGRCRFRAFVTNPRTGAQWVDVTDKKGAARAVRPEQVRTVHSVSKIRKNKG